MIERQGDVELNIRDEWDSTPLYYACLCGHSKLVDFLLSQGASCDASTFDGERCIYGALTERIRKTLLDYSVLTAEAKRRRPFAEFLRKLYEGARVNGDFRFRLADRKIPALRCVLCTRSDFFAEKFTLKWKEKNSTNLQTRLVNANSLKLLLEWIYTGQTKVEMDGIPDLERLAKQCRLPRLNYDLCKGHAKVKAFMSSKKGANNIKHVQIESEEAKNELKVDLLALALSGFPPELRNDDIFPFPPSLPEFFDLTFNVRGAKFKANKAIFCTRSDYFHALIINDPFNESRNSVINVNSVSADVFAVITTHVYSDTVDLNPEIVYEVLEAADFFLLPGLKRECGNFLGEFLDCENAVQLIRTARLYDLKRLEQRCFEFVADFVEDIVKRGEFLALVEEDAKSVKSRQETDSIDIIDEVRFFITTKYFMNQPVKVRKLAVIDDTLNRLNLTA